jgi:aminopeptidase N
MKFLPFVLAALLFPGSVFAQHTHQDSLRGSYGPSRDWWDVSHYDLSVAFDIEKKEISGCNKISLSYYDNIESKAVNTKRKLQIDLQEPMKLDSAYFGNFKIKAADIVKDGNAYFISLPDLGRENALSIYFHGSPKVAKKAPWDGGIIWTQDQNKNPWVTIACQGLGASCWYPCKDSQYDEPDSASMHFTCPENLVCVSNGVFAGKTVQNNTATYSWKVVNPINSYCIIPYIGDYVNMHEHFQGENGHLEVDYWVIRGNEEKAKTQFMDAPRTLEALEYWFGPYPFYEDGYKLVQAPHLGMEHQSAVAYGNGFQNGYLGTDLSGTGIGLQWDFIIVHESGHEWFGNNVTSQDIADMWIHEGFTNYSEVLFTDYWFGTEAGNAYAVGLRKNIQNDIPIIGPYGVNKEGSGDMYYKGSNMIHTIRQVVDNDTLFRDVLRDINETFWHQTVTTEQIEVFMSTMLNVDLQPTFDQYLRTTQIPTLELCYKKGKMKYRWTNCIKSFNMPVVLGKTHLMPTRKWKSIPVIDYHAPIPNIQFYINYNVKLAKSFEKNANNFAIDYSDLKSITQPNSK